MSSNNYVACPVCDRSVSSGVIEEHVNKCLFLNTQSKPSESLKRRSLVEDGHNNDTSQDKRIKLSPKQPPANTNEPPKQANASKLNTPLAEQMRPESIDDLVGQSEAFGPGSMIRSLLEQKQIPNMILWGPPGCGKTSLANVIGAICKKENNLRFVKLSATMSGINEVKEVVKIAKNEIQFKRQTVLFMDEIHRFNKLQQDVFLPHVESGTIVLIGATTENPSFSLNNALLSRCRVIVMEKLMPNDIMIILERSLRRKDAVIVESNKSPEVLQVPEHRWTVSRPALQWLAEICDGDARIALGALELALAGSQGFLTLKNIQDGIKRTHILYDRAGEEHYNIISALHKSIRAGADNAALYWCSRAIVAGEDPRFIARRLMRAASEDIGLADSRCLVEAVACAQSCQLVGAPECDVMLCQLAVRLARAPKSTEVYHAMLRCKKSIEQTKGPLPSVPLHLRNAPTKLMKELGYGQGYNTLSHEESGLTYMPDGMENVNYFKPTSKM